MGEEEELSQSMEELEMAKARLEHMTKEAELLQMSLNEHLRAVATIRSFIDLPEGKDVLVPIGAGAFIPARSPMAVDSIYPSTPVIWPAKKSRGRSLS